MDWYDKEKWDEQFVTMCKKAEPFLKGFDEPKNATQLLCDGYSVYIRPGEKGSGIYELQRFANDDIHYKGLFGEDHTEFRVYRVDELQNIYKKIKDLSIDCCIIEFKKWISNPQFWQWVDYHQLLSWDKIWLAFVMESCFKRFWNLDLWDEVDITNEIE